MLPEFVGRPPGPPHNSFWTPQGLFKWHWAEAPAPQKRETSVVTPAISAIFSHLPVTGLRGYRTVIAKGALLVAIHRHRQRHLGARERLREDDLNLELAV